MKTRSKYCMFFLLYLGVSNLYAETSVSLTSEAANENVLIAQQAKITVKGIVKDNTGEVLPGVSIQVIGSGTGTVTNSDGQFTIGIPAANSQLKFSYIGYKELIVSCNGKNVLNITLMEDSEMLSEVQVIAYGVQKKVTVTGSVSSVGTKELLKSPVPNLAHSLAGNLPGLSAVQYSGQPGADDPTIFIRGIGSLDAARAKPLILVDGVERSFFRLDPNEVEDITILKDASSTAVFGVRGANGVILVTTKHGQSGEAKISISTSVSVQKPIRVFDYSNSYDYAILFNESQHNDGVPEAELAFKPHVIQAFKDHSNPLLYPDTDWIDMIMKPSSFQSQHNLSISGGTDRVRYFTSIGILTQDGLFRSFDKGYNSNYSYQRYNYRANVDIDVTKTTLLKVNLGGRLEDTYQPNTKGNLYRGLTIALPFAGSGIYDGKWVRASQDNLPFPDGPLENGDAFELFYGRGFNQTMKNVINLDIALQQKLDFITKGLTFNIKGAYNSEYTHTKTRSKSMPYYTTHQNSGTKEIIFRKKREETPLSFSEGFGKNRDWYLEGSFNYARSFGGHNVSAMALYNQLRQQYPDPDKFKYPEIPRGYVGMVGRVTYDYSNRYMVDFNVGYNGSENFASDKRYGVFPAFSVGWIISEEKFMKNVTFVNFLKLRASYGIVGNDLTSDGSRFYFLPDTYNPQTGGYNFGINVSGNKPGTVENRIGNPMVTWEKAAKQNYGIDFSLFDQRLSGSFDYFIENRNDILTQLNTVPGYIAVDMPVVNIGKVRNQGYELALKWNHKISDFRYWLNFNMAFARNKVIYKDEIPRKYDWRYETGKPVGQQFGYIFDGFVTEADIKGGKLPDQKIVLAPGDAKYKDLNGDSVIDDNDIAAIGNPIYPELTGGLTVGFEYKGFDFSMMWVGTGSVSRFVSDGLRIPFGQTKQRALYQYMVDQRWTPETAETAGIPRLSFLHMDNNYTRNSTLWLKDASYLRLKNVQLGYTFSGSWMKKLYMQNMRIYVSGENLLTLDKLKIADPEATDAARFEYPLLMVGNVGLSINF